MRLQVLRRKVPPHRWPGNLPSLPFKRRFKVRQAPNKRNMHCVTSPTRDCLTVAPYLGSWLHSLQLLLSWHTEMKI